MRNKTHVFLLVIVVLVAGAAAAGASLLYAPSAPDLPEASTSPDGNLLDGRITGLQRAEADPEAEQVLSPDAEPLTITVRLTSGRDVTFDMIDETGETFSVGQDVRVIEAQGPDEQSTYYINDVKREQPLLILAAIFLVAVLAFGRWQGLRALVGLGITLAVIVAFVVPAVLAGRDPVLVALVASVLIMVVTLYLSHGVRPKTTAAVLGTLGALAVTVGLSWVFIEFASLTGLADEEARLASTQLGGLSLRGLLLAGIIIGALGVLDDVTMSQASAVFEFGDADPSAGSPQLFSRAMRVGRDHVAATINTLFLAYAGASLPLLILFNGSPDPPNVILSSEVVAVEIVRTLVGSIGLMASVPLTTALAAWLASRRVPAAGRVPASRRVPAAGRDAGAAGDRGEAYGPARVGDRVPVGEPWAAGERAPADEDRAAGERAPVDDWARWDDHEPVAERGPVDDWASPAERHAAGERAPVGDRVAGEERLAARPRRLRTARDEQPEAPEEPTPSRERKPRLSRRRKADEEATAFSDVKPFSADDAAESEWEKRLRDSYKLDQLHAARRQTIRRYAERQQEEEQE